MTNDTSRPTSSSVSAALTSQLAGIRAFILSYTSYTRCALQPLARAMKLIGAATP